jgi:hypothetical protein
VVFIQVIECQVSDPKQVHAALDRWVEELSGGATGWLGTTAGVTEDGRFIAMVRFESQQAARRNSDRHEQDQWWTETSKLFTGEATFRDSDRVDVDVNGDPDTAGFVQIIQGRSSDPDRSRELMNQDADKWAEYRPDVVGSVGAEHEGGLYTMALYFTSEQEARAGEAKAPPPELRAQMEEMDSLSVGEPKFFDLKEPWLHSPR